MHLITVPAIKAGRVPFRISNLYALSHLALAKFHEVNTTLYLLIDEAMKSRQAMQTAQGQGQLSHRSVLKLVLHFNFSDVLLSDFADFSGSRERQSLTSISLLQA